MVKKLTPAQQQYIDLKQEYKDALLFFRLGDFYELFYEDAKIAHKELNITLTSRHKKSSNPIPMAGVPYHAAEKYIKKLIGAGYKVAIAEQVGQVVPGKIVDRKVVRVVTPGTDIQEKEQYNNLASLYFSGKKDERGYHLARGDISLGSFFTKSFSSIELLLKYLLLLDPQEVIIDIHFPDRYFVEQYIHQVLSRIISFDDIPYDTIHYLKDITKTSSLDGYGKALQEGRGKALSLLFSYSEKMQKQSISIVHNIHYMSPEKYITFDEITIRNLEVFLSRTKNTVSESLYGVINKCKTAMGSRLLYKRLSTPIHDIQRLNQRLSCIEYYVSEKEERIACISLLESLGDLPRLLSKILYRKAQATKVQQLMFSLKGLLEGKNMKVLGNALKGQGLESIEWENIKELSIFLQNIIKDEQIQDDIGYIADNYDSLVDKYREVAYHSDELLLNYQHELFDYTGGVRVKVKYIRNQGYFLEITPRDVEKFEKKREEGNEKFGFIRCQTLKTGQRYTTIYLTELEGSILEAKDLLRKKEMKILLECIEKLRIDAPLLFNFFESLARLDLATSFADMSEKKDRTKPILGKAFLTKIEQGRHPVVEEFLDKKQQFIPNDCILDKENFFHIITGPNMGGKSTFLRQNAIIVLLAHAGLYVPAKVARISLVSGIFARIGSGDALAKNQSTFMTEMLEMANILHNATKRSFIILDELGRGTSTYDGLSLAKAISVYMCQTLKAKTLFATHYHEITELDATVNGCENFSMSVYETDNEVIFLKKVLRGKANKSYGIDVAKLAGIPSSILKQAEYYLSILEKNDNKKNKKIRQESFDFDFMNDEYRKKYQSIKENIKNININDMTPMEALICLQKLKEDI